MTPNWSCGYGWVVHIDLADAAMPDADVQGCLLEVARLADMLNAAAPGSPILRFQTYAPKDLYPGYFYRVKVQKGLGWFPGAGGTTPRNVNVWNDPRQSPYYDTPTSYVGSDGDPVFVAHAIVHEVFHGMMPAQNSGHNTEVGWIFSYNMAPVPGLPIVTPLAGQRIGGTVYNASRGYRLMLNDVVVIPHLVSPDNARPGPFPDDHPDFAPPTTGNITRASDKKTLDQVYTTWR